LVFVLKSCSFWQTVDPWRIVLQKILPCHESTFKGFLPSTGVLFVKYSNYPIYVFSRSRYNGFEASRHDEDLSAGQKTDVAARASTVAGDPWGRKANMFFLRSIVLNAGERSREALEQPIDIALTLAMADLKARVLDLQRGVVHYDAIRGSEAFKRYRVLSRALKSFDLRSLEKKEQRLAFWINIYNTAVIHGVIELGLKKSVREVPRFFDRIVYEIGGYGFSLNEIEHGILRGNRRHPYRLLKPFRRKDARVDYAVIPMDPRIHFALVCGARSCPPIGFYEAEEIDFQLQLAATSFINSLQVRILPLERTILLSMIFRWYRPDFGGSDRSLIDTVLRFLDEGEKKEFLKQNRDKVRVRYQPYDWNLNE
jgi:hypothetical protein